MFLTLLFAHLVADFILQPSKLIAWKFKSWKGVAVHAGIHFLAYFLILLPFLYEIRMIAILLGVALSHFFVDQWKVKHERHDHHYARSFVTDQLLHFSFLALASWLIGKPNWHINIPALQKIYTAPILWIGLAFGLIASFGVEIFLYQFQREKGNTAFKPHYSSLLLRGALVVCICVGWVILKSNI